MGSLGRRVWLVWVNCGAPKWVRDKIRATYTNTYNLASLPSSGTHHKLGWEGRTTAFSQ